ncbi:hypothetical protein CGRA01v4_14190 [Colletotrichum graminicola]|uniref:Uncharacterized protein n=1 Tax=Colletotrichum graminicola (strain M1.001 / M2 / FGSC 10212) TaxID=645133 RepID=E3Q526_COLGM|nr:uncharacterized protein GLRG_00937 [Colletotrichum graminicola M1.001]EFQ25793.1 hypothetical protein GLRG_00937 [Colletotrichum graminicola M1.001]WDK22898.1 hypothetical protein CGRA01v4_14190 [Colletotrichum graminicola]
MSLNMAQPTLEHGRQVVLGSRLRPVKIQDAVYSRLIEMAEDDEDCEFARWLLLQVCEIFRDDIDDQKAIVPIGMGERDYTAGWRDALATIRGLSSLCLKGPQEDGDPSRPEPPDVFSARYGDVEQYYQKGLGIRWEEERERLNWGDEVLARCGFTGATAEAFENDQQNSSTNDSQASSSLINTPSNVSISDSVLEALFPPESSAELSSASNGSSPSKRAPSTPDSRQPPNGHNRNLNKSDIIRGLDTTALLAHFERQSRLSERRIVAELGRTSLLRQAIFQDRFFGRVPSFAGAPGGDDLVNDEYDATDITDGINEPFLGEAQQMRAVRQVKTLFRQWRKAAAEDQGEADEGSDGGTRVTGREDGDDDDEGVSSDSASLSHAPEPWLDSHAGAAPPPSPGSESVYSDDTLWPSAASEPCDETSALVAPPTHHYCLPDDQWAMLHRHRRLHQS